MTINQIKVEREENQELADQREVAVEPPEHDRREDEEGGHNGAQPYPLGYSAGKEIAGKELQAEAHQKPDAEILKLTVSRHTCELEWQGKQWKRIGKEYRTGKFEPVLGIDAKGNAPRRMGEELPGQILGHGIAILQPSYVCRL